MITNNEFIFQLLAAHYLYFFMQNGPRMRNNSPTAWLLDISLSAILLLGLVPLIKTPVNLCLGYKEVEEQLGTFLLWFPDDCRILVILGFDIDHFPTASEDQENGIGEWNPALNVKKELGN